MGKSKVSVIVPIYNVATYVERCVRSLFEQTLQEIEYIFVDDASPDDSISIVKRIMTEYPERASHSRIVVHDENKGIPAARNTGISIASGDFIVHCDSDDWVEKDMYEKLYNAAITNNSDYVVCDFYMELPNQQLKYSTVDSMIDKVELMKCYMTYGWNVLWNVLASRELYEKYDLRAYEGHSFCEDYGLSVRLLYYAQKYIRLSLPLYHYNRCNLSSIVSNANSSQSLARNTESQIYIYNQINNFFRDNQTYFELERELAWRMLSAKRGWLFIPEKWEKYRSVEPASNKYIWSNPLCSIKDKICQTLILSKWTAPLIKIIKIVDAIVHK